MNLTELIRDDYAKRPKGFRCHDIPGAERAVTSAIDRALKKGLIYRAKVSYRHVVYFGDVRVAMEFEALHKVSPERAKFNARPRVAKMQDSREAKTPPHIVIQHCPTPTPRFHVSGPVIGGLATAGIGRYQLPASPWVRA